MANESGVRVTSLSKRDLSSKSLMIESEGLTIVEKKRKKNANGTCISLILVMFGTSVRRAIRELDKIKQNTIGGLKLLFNGYSNILISTVLSLDFDRCTLRLSSQAMLHLVIVWFA